MCGGGGGGEQSGEHKKCLKYQVANLQVSYILEGRGEGEGRGRL